jgi:hypothetical protein
MNCFEADSLLSAFAKAAKHLAECACDLSRAVGQRDEFEDARWRVMQAREVCRAASLALKKHRAEHNCQSGSPPKTGWPLF